jgi:hypothetical protein
MRRLPLPLWEMERIVASRIGIRLIHTYFASDLYENLERRRSQIREFEQGWRGIPNGVYRRVLAKKWPDKKNFLAMAIDSDMNGCGSISRGSRRRNYEGVGNPWVYCYFEWLFRFALLGHGVPF